MDIVLKPAVATPFLAFMFQCLILDLMVGKIGFSCEPILAFPTRQGCTPESYELVATFISV